jgi:hypothetical protein
MRFTMLSWALDHDESLHLRDGGHWRKLVSIVLVVAASYKISTYYIVDEEYAIAMPIMNTNTTPYWSSYEVALCLLTHNWFRVMVHGLSHRLYH